MSSLNFLTLGISSWFGVALEIHRPFPINLVLIIVNIILEGM